MWMIKSCWLQTRQQSGGGNGWLRDARMREAAAQFDGMLNNSKFVKLWLKVEIAVSVQCFVTAATKG